VSRFLVDHDWSALPVGFQAAHEFSYLFFVVFSGIEWIKMDAADWDKQSPQGFWNIRSRRCTRSVLRHVVILLPLAVNSKWFVGPFGFALVRLEMKSSMEIVILLTDWS